MKLTVIAGTVAGLLAVSSPAYAAPVTVDLRIEGATRTLFEGPVTTDTAPFVASDGLHECGTGPTRGAVISTAAQAGAFAMQASWNATYSSPTFETIAGDSVGFDGATGRYLAEFKNGVSAEVGSCADPVSAGDKVLFAYSSFGDLVLDLSGPARAKPGETVTVKVTDGKDPVPGASVGGKQTGPDGTVTLAWPEKGDHDLKASKDGAIRSNRLRVCVTDGADGACGTTRPTPIGATNPAAAPDRTAPAASLTGLRDKQVFTTGPRELKGSFAADPSGIKTVKLRLAKRSGGKCWYFSGKMETFRRTKCGTEKYFAIGDKADWSYLLPARLGMGRYVLDAIAIDGAGNRTPLARGTTRVVFTVR